MKLLLVFLGVLGLTVAQQCDPNYEYECANGRCIPEEWICDGDNDCGDESDEQNCPSTPPPTMPPCNGFMCPSGRCIPSSYVCDGDNDCNDWSDETDCPNCQGRVCDTDNKCIPERYICNGEADCDDGKDEVECPPCPEFTCENGRCVPNAYICDGDNDCGDGSDERWVPGMPGFGCPASGICLPPRQVCDGNDDCGDGSDETEEACPCNEGEIRCAQLPGSNVPGACIPPEWVCDEDGIWDCIDGSDEANCTMTVKKPRHHIKTKPKKRIPGRESSIQKLMKIAKQGTKAEKERRQRKTKPMHTFKHLRTQKQKIMY